MATYKSVHTGTAIDEAVTKVQEGLPKATTSTLGGIIVGDNLTIDDNGKLSASGGGSGGGTKWYKHTLYFGPTTGVKVYVNTISNGTINSSTYSYSKLKMIIVSNDNTNYTGSYLPIFDSNVIYFAFVQYSNIYSYGVGVIPCSLTRDSDDGYTQISYWCNDRNTLHSEYLRLGYYEVTDTVTEL